MSQTMKKPNSLLEDLKPLLPAIAARADQAERERTVPAENIALLKGIGLHQAFLPRPMAAWKSACRSSPNASPPWPAPAPAPPGP
jgi:hypothetical protein